MTLRERPVLRFRADGTFTIAQFTDVHWSNGGLEDARSLDLMERILDAEAPDLVVLTGDILEGSLASDPSQAYRSVFGPMERRGVPWAAVFGNHDDEGASSRAELLALQQSHRLCLTEAGPPGVTGVSNYVLRVLSPKTDRIQAALYFLDSNAYNSLGVGDYAWIAHDQIAWYLKAAQGFRREWGEQPQRIPALAFFHIPIPEYQEAWERSVCKGSRNEPVCGPLLNSGLFAALLEAGDVMGTFVGHDHVNDFEGELFGVRLCYGRATGYAPYGQEGFRRGARLVRLLEGVRRFETWLRLDDGSLVDEPEVHEPEGL